MDAQMPPEPPLIPEHVPDMKQLVADSLTEHAQNEVKSAGRRMFRQKLYDILPRALHPLVPGHRYTFQQTLEAEGKRRVSSMIWGCAITAVVIGTAVAGMAIVGGMIWWELAGAK